MDSAACHPLCRRLEAPTTLAEQHGIFRDVHCGYCAGAIPNLVAGNQSRVAPAVLFPEPAPTYSISPHRRSGWITLKPSTVHDVRLTPSRSFSFLSHLTGHLSRAQGPRRSFQSWQHPTRRERWQG
jgi:hypothetical protein